MEIKKDIEYIKNSVKQNDIDHKEIISKIDNFVQSAEDRFAAKKDHKESLEHIDNIIISLDDKYAPIRTWTIMVWAGRIIGFIIIAGVIGVIAQSYLHLNI